MVQRSAWVANAVVMQFLLGMLFFVISAFLLSLIQSPELKLGPDAASAICGLKVAAAILGPLALLILGGFYGMWKSKAWGWWVALFSNAAMLSILIYSTMDDGVQNLNWEMAVLTVLSAIVPTLLLLPAVRKFYVVVSVVS